MRVKVEYLWTLTGGDEASRVDSIISLIFSRIIVWIRSSLYLSQNFKFSFRLQVEWKRKQQTKGKRKMDGLRQPEPLCGPNRFISEGSVPQDQ